MRRRRERDRRVCRDPSPEEALRPAFSRADRGPTRCCAPSRPSPSDLFLEIGPGQGALTRPLAAAARHVIAFEIDRDLAAALRQDGPAERDGGRGRLPRDHAGQRPCDARLDWRVGGGRPQGGRQSSLQHRGGHSLQVSRAVPGRRAAARCRDHGSAGSGRSHHGVDRGRETTACSACCCGARPSIERLLALPPGAFRPQPQVRSTLLRLRFHPPVPAARDERAFQGLVRAVFTRRRKTLANALTAYTAPVPFSAVDVLQRADIDPRRRPETLDLVEFVRLSDTIGEPDRPVIGRSRRDRAVVESTLLSCR